MGATQMKYILACLVVLAASPATAQFRSCLGNNSPACRLERQMEEQERQNQLRHDQMMQEMRRQNQRLEQPQPYRQPQQLYPDINFPRLGF
jgi:hypothetical protein